MRRDEQPRRAGSEQMREEEGDTRQKGEERKEARQSARLLRTGSDYSLPGGDGRNGAVQRRAHPQRARYPGGHMRNGRGGGGGAREPGGARACPYA